MCRRVAILFLSGVAVTSLGLGAASAQAQTRATNGLRTGTPRYVAQDATVPVPSSDFASPSLGMADPIVVKPGQNSAISRTAPPRASRPVQSLGLRGSTQRPVKASQPVVGSLPPALPPPPPVRKKSVVELDPYAPLGLRFGNVVFRPGLTSSLGYDTNPERSSGATRKGSPFNRNEIDLEAQSDWNVNELRGKLRAGYSQYFRNQEASRPDGEGNLDLRLDASRDTRFLLESRFKLDTQRPGSPDLTSAVIGRPPVYQYGGSAGVTQDFNRLQLTLRGSVDRSDYEDAELSSGAILSQADRNQTQYGLRLRAAYEVTPGFKPFVQGEVDRREFDQKIDSSGYERSSSGVTARLGTSYELSRLLTAELSGGYQDRAYEDPRLKNLRGFVGDAAVLWTPTPLTTVTLRGTADLGDTTIAGSSGTTARRVTLEVAHALRRNLIVTGTAGFGRTEYEGTGPREDLITLGARLEYKLTRTFAIRASFTHERLNSTAVGNDYTANVSQVGLRMQF